MSYTLVTLLCVVAFLSAIPSSSAEAYDKSSTQYPLIQAYVSERAVFKEDCTNVKEGSLAGLADSIKLANPTVFTAAGSVQQISETITTLFTGKTDLDQPQINMIHIFAYQVMFANKDCTKLKPTALSDTPAMRKAILAKTDALYANANALGTKRITAVCLVLDIVKSFEKEYSSAVSAVDSAALTKINDAVTKANIGVQENLGTEEIILAYDLISTTFDSISSDPVITGIIGVVGKENPAKRCQVICNIGNGLDRKLNPELSTSLRETLHEYIFHQFLFPDNCKYPSSADLKIFSKTLLGSGKLLGADATHWSTQVTLYELFKNAEYLVPEEIEKSRVVAARLAIPIASGCKIKSASLGKSKDKVLRKGGFDKVKTTCPSGSCGAKALGYHCHISTFLLQIASITDPVPVFPKRMTAAVKAVLAELKPAITADSKNSVSIPNLTKAVMAAKGVQQIVDWIAENPLRYALLVCHLESEVVNPTTVVEDTFYQGLTKGSIAVIIAGIIITLAEIVFGTWFIWIRQS